MGWDKQRRNWRKCSLQRTPTIQHWTLPKHTCSLIPIHHSKGSTQSLQRGRHILCKHLWKILVKRRANHQYNRLILAQQVSNLFSHKDTNITLSLDRRSSVASKVGHMTCVVHIHLKNLVSGCRVFQKWTAQLHCHQSFWILASWGAGMVTLHFMPLAFIVSRLDTFLTYILHMTVKY